jgi:acyl-CoA reductase-like NAD-dependent aldehyde dehydrogenase
MLKVVSPFDLSPLQELETTTPEAVESALQRLFETYQDRARWLSKAERIERLEHFHSLLHREHEELARLATREGGKPLVDSRIEVTRALSGIKKAIAALSALTGREISMNENAASRGRIAYTYYEPRGVVLAISAFNHPLNLLVHQAIPAFAAGCPVLIKPSSSTPLTALRFVELLRAAKVGPEFVEVVLTTAAQTERLVQDKRVAFLSFIGSGEVGWRLRSLLPPGAACALEHGGVAPVLVDETADVGRLIPLLAKGGYYHAGQVCVSVQRVFAPRAIAETLGQELAHAAAALKVGDPLDETTLVGPLIRPSEVERVDQWVREAKDGGGKLLSGGQRLSETLYAPTVVYDPPESVRLSRAEVFGPVVAIYPTLDLEEAVQRANLPDAYFQAALFTNRLDRALDLGRRLHGMNVLINDHTAFRVDWMPFGGHRHSGLGVGGIEPTLREMSLERMIVFHTGGA